MKPATKYTAQQVVNLAAVDTNNDGLPDALAICKTDGSNIRDPRTVSTTSASAVTPNSDTTDLYCITALAVSTTINEPDGTPVNGRLLEIRFLDDGTGRTLAWNAIFVARGVTIPLTTTASKYLRVLAEYNSTASKWDVIATAEES